MHPGGARGQTQIQWGERYERSRDSDKYISEKRKPGLIGAEIARKFNSGTESISCDSINDTPR